MRAFVTALALACWTGVASAGEVAWERDYEEAKARSTREGKLLFIDFYADW